MLLQISRHIYIVFLTETLLPIKQHNLTDKTGQFIVVSENDKPIPKEIVQSFWHILHSIQFKRLNENTHD